MKCNCDKNNAVIKNNGKKPDIVVESKRNDNIYYMFSDEIFIYGDNNKSISVPTDFGALCFYDMYYVHDELYIVVATNKDYDYIYVLDEEDMIINKRGCTK